MNYLILNRERLSVRNYYRRFSRDLTLYYKVFNSLTSWAPREHIYILVYRHIVCILFLVSVIFEILYVALIEYFGVAS